MRTFSALMTITLLVAAPVDQVEAVFEEDALSRAAANRAAYGLAADAALVTRIVESGQDIGTERWGIVLTAAEDDTLDLPGRMEFVSDAAEELLPYVRSLPTFAGLYFVPSENGRLVIALTERSPEVDARIAELTPASSRGVEVRLASHTFAELKSAAEKTWIEWPSLSADLLAEVAVDEARNGIRLTVQASNLDAARVAATKLQEILGVPFDVIWGEPEPDLACNSRTNCHTPMRAGIRVDNRESWSGMYCTMGFHIRISGNEQWITAGHCGYVFPSVAWYHPGYGLVGSELATMYYPVFHEDQMRVEMTDSQASDLIYNTVQLKEVRAARPGNTGETVCVSLGVSATYPCQVIENQWVSWTSFSCNCTMWGADLLNGGVVSQEGDSGSPWIAQYGSTSTGVWAIGVLNTASKFAHVSHALTYWGASIVS